MHSLRSVITETAKEPAKVSNQGQYTIKSRLTIQQSYLVTFQLSGLYITLASPNFLNSLENGAL